MASFIPFFSFSADFTRFLRNNNSSFFLHNFLPSSQQAASKFLAGFILLGDFAIRFLFRFPAAAAAPSSDVGVVAMQRGLDRHCGVGLRFSRHSAEVERAECGGSRGREGHFRRRRRRSARRRRRNGDVVNISRCCVHGSGGGEGNGGGRVTLVVVAGIRRRKGRGFGQLRFTRSQVRQTHTIIAFLETSQPCPDLVADGESPSFVPFVIKHRASRRRLDLLFQFFFEGRLL